MHRVIDFCRFIWYTVKAIPHRLVRKAQTAAVQNRKADFMRCCLRACSVSFYVRLFEYNYAEDKEKIRSKTVALQVFLTQSPSKFAERTYEKYQTGSYNIFEETGTLQSTLR